VYNKTATTPITIAGHMMQPNYCATYLGFHRTSRDVGTHLKGRLTKAKRASFAVMAMLKRIPDLRPKVQIQVAKCTVAAVLTYGIEACNNTQIKKLQSQASKLMRRAGRYILGAPVCVANQTV
jgi:hypothetical protein